MLLLYSGFYLHECIKEDLSDLVPLNPPKENTNYMFSLAPPFLLCKIVVSHSIDFNNNINNNSMPPLLVSGISLQ